jgi:chromosome segregation ATPase
MARQAQLEQQLEAANTSNAQLAGMLDDTRRRAVEQTAALAAKDVQLEAQRQRDDGSGDRWKRELGRLELEREEMAGAANATKTEMADMKKQVAELEAELEQCHGIADAAVSLGEEHMNDAEAQEVEADRHRARAEQLALAHTSSRSELAAASAVVAQLTTEAAAQGASDRHHAAMISRNDKHHAAELGAARLELESLGAALAEARAENVEAGRQLRVAFKSEGRLLGARHYNRAVICG